MTKRLTPEQIAAVQWVKDLTSIGERATIDWLRKMSIEARPGIMRRNVQAMLRAKERQLGLNN